MKKNAKCTTGQRVSSWSLSRLPCTLGENFRHSCAAGNHESRSKKGRKSTNEATNEPTDGAAGLAERERTYEEGRTKPGINSGRRTYGRTDGRTRGESRARVRKAGDHDETRENRLRQNMYFIHVQNLTHIYCYVINCINIYDVYTDETLGIFRPL